MRIIDLEADLETDLIQTITHQEITARQKKSHTAISTGNME